MSKKYRNPALTVDVIIEIDMKIVLISRKHPPLGWAIPGGFVDYGEKIEDAALREAEEETGLQVTLQTLLGVYSDPSRDNRRHTASAVYIGHSKGTPKAADDAQEARLFSIDELPELCFDHQQILDDYKVYKQEGVFPPPRPTS